VDLTPRNTLYNKWKMNQRLDAHNRDYKKVALSDSSRNNLLHAGRQVHSKICNMLDAH